MTTITDPRNQTAVFVGSDNRMQIRGWVVSHEASDSKETASAYFVPLGTDALPSVTLTATGGPMLYITNTSSTEDFFVENIFISCDTAGNISEWKKNVTVGSLGNNSAITPVNANFSSGNTAAVTAWGWDEVGDGMTGFSAGTVFHTWVVPVGVTSFPIDGVIILGENDNLLIEAGGAGAEFTCAIRGHFDPKE